MRTLGIRTGVGISVRNETNLHVVSERQWCEPPLEACMRKQPTPMGHHRHALYLAELNRGGMHSEVMQHVESKVRWVTRRCAL